MDAGLHGRAAAGAASPGIARASARNGASPAGKSRRTGKDCRTGKSCRTGEARAPGKTTAPGRAAARRRFRPARSAVGPAAAEGSGLI